MSVQCLLNFIHILQFSMRGWYCKICRRHSKYVVSEQQWAKTSQKANEISRSLSDTHATQNRPTLGLHVFIYTHRFLTQALWPAYSTSQNLTKQISQND